MIGFRDRDSHALAASAGGTAGRLGKLSNASGLALNPLALDNTERRPFLGASFRLSLSCFTSS